MSVSVLIFIFVLIIICSCSIKIIKEYQRAAVFRLGQYIGIRGPGLIFVVPMIDKLEIIDLNKWIPDWQALSKNELNDRVKSVALSQSRK